MSHAMRHSLRHGSFSGRSLVALQPTRYRNRGAPMKVRPAQVAEHRAALIRAATQLFNAHGFDGVGVAEICRHAGLSQGALYAQFGSKAELAAEALSAGMASSHVRLIESQPGHPTLADRLSFYLSSSQRDDLTGGCTLAAAAGDVARRDEHLSDRFADGFLQMVETLQATQPSGESDHDLIDRDRAMVMAATMIGSLVVARATAKASPQLSDDLLAATRRLLTEFGAAAAATPVPAAGRRSAVATAQSREQLRQAIRQPM